MRTLVLLVLVAFGLAYADDDWGPYGEVCLVKQPQLYDPSLFTSVPWYTIDLDLPEHQRWEEVGKKYGAKMKRVLDIVEQMMDIVTGGLWKPIIRLFDGAADKLNEPYRSEIKALAEISGMDLAELTLLNMFYEVAKACTSVVAKDKTGKVYHGRNLDFGFGFIWNKDIRTWELTDALKDLTINVEFMQGGKLIFKGVTFAGHLGIVTGLKPNAFTVSTNTRFGSTADGLINFFMHGLGDKELLIYANRDMLMNCKNYDEAINYIENVPLIARGYFILSSADGRGMVVTRNYTGTDHEDKIDASQWFSLETNYDWDKPVMFLDDRRGPGLDCMKQLGQDKVGLAGLFQVLSSKPTLNKATVYTTVMQVNDGVLQTVTRNCEDPCWFV